jgi:hypothetical protein
MKLCYNGKCEAIQYGHGFLFNPACSIIAYDSRHLSEQSFCTKDRTQDKGVNLAICVASHLTVSWVRSFVLEVSMGYVPKEKIKIVCVQCGKKVETHCSWQKFCSDKCGRLYKEKQNNDVRYKFVNDDVNTGTIGAMHELLVCYNLMGRGYQVFRSMSPASPFDLICIKDSRSLRVEVKTLQIHNNAIYIPSHIRKNAGIVYDILAVVCYGEKITYFDDKLSEVEL